MKEHYDLTGEPFTGVFVDAPGMFVACTDQNATKVSNVKLTVRLGQLCPSTMKEIWNELDTDHPDEAEMREAIAQHFFDITGKDITDKESEK